MKENECAWLGSSNDCLLLSLVVQAGARRSEIAGIFDGCLKIRIAAPAVEGAANAEIIDFFSSLLKIKKNCIKMHKGEFYKRKVIAISSQNLQATRDILLAAVAEVTSRGGEDPKPQK
jgi:uncharacterized protein (TIGR00251 family)